MWQRLLQPEYLLESIPGQPGQFRVLYWLLAVGSVGAWLLSVAAWRRNPASRRTATLTSSLLSGLGLALIGCSFAGIPYLSMRALVFTSNVSAALYPLAVAVMRAEPVRVWARHRQALLGQTDESDPPLKLPSQVLLLAGHLLGLALLAQHYAWQPWVLVVCGGLLGVQCWLAWRWRHVRLEYLAPLLLLYALLLARWLWVAVRVVLGYRGFDLPPDWDARLNVNLALWLTVSWTLGLHAYVVFRERRRERLLAAGLAGLALVACLGWAARTYVHNRTHGVTGSDPYCYAQMGVDVAQTGLPVHRFPLASLMRQWGVSPEAGVHLGYHLPFDAESRSASVALARMASSSELPETSFENMQFGYRIGDKGEFTDAGLLDALDQRTGTRMPKTSFEMAPDQGKTAIYVTWRDKRGEQADVVPINFDPTAALVDEQKKILEQFWTSWIAFREYNGMLVYFTQLVSYRCAIKQARYGLGDQPVDKVFKLPPCDPADTNSVPDGATLYMKVPPKTGSMQVQLIYADGTQSPTRSFNAPK